MVETRLGPTIDDRLIHIDGYSVVRQDRNTSGGGVALYMKDTINVNVLYRSDTNDKPKVPEYQACQIWQEEGPFVLVVVIYRLPKIAFKQKLLSLPSKLCPVYSHKVIMGDLNADLSSPDGAGVVRDLASEFSLKLLDYGPTHKVGTSHTFIDVIRVNNDDVVLDHATGKKANFHNAHDVIKVTIEPFITNPLPPRNLFLQKI